VVQQTRQKNEEGFYIPLWTAGNLSAPTVPRIWLRQVVAASMFHGMRANIF
jgi:hypothetical protein